MQQNTAKYGKRTIKVHRNAAKRSETQRNAAERGTLPGPTGWQKKPWPGPRGLKKAITSR